MLDILKNVKKGSTLLLHTCCAPCSTRTISLLSDYFKITVYYYNPNIYPYTEYIKRKEEQIRFLNEYQGTYKISFLDCDYDNDKYNEVVKGLEQEKEGGKRCYACYMLRLKKTAQTAKNLNFDYFGTSLTVSPYKNAKWINEIGRQLENNYHVKYLVSDLKKDNGYLTSILMSKTYNLYRQNFCGCIYSKR